MSIENRNTPIDLAIVIFIITLFLMLVLPSLSTSIDKFFRGSPEESEFRREDIGDLLVKNLTFNSKEEIFNWVKSLETPGRLFGSAYSSPRVAHSISGGHIPPGSEAFVYVGTLFDEEFQGISFNVFIIRIWPQPPIILYEKAFNSTPFKVSYDLPDDEDTIYGIFVYAFNDSEVVDILKSLIVVPVQEVKARMILDREVYRLGDTLTLTIVNDGPTYILTGYFYRLFKWNGSSWIEVPPPDKTFVSVGILVKPGNSWSQQILLENLEPGRYKIVKTVDGEGTDITLNLEAVFTIEG